MKTFLTSVNASSASGPELAAEPGLLEAAERRRVAHRGVRVDRQVAGLDAAGDAQRAADVAGPDRAGQAVLACRWPCATASASSSNGSTATTGPKTSSRQTRSAGSTRQHAPSAGTRSPGPSGALAAERDVDAGRPRRTTRRGRAARALISGPISASSSAGSLDPHALHRRLEQLQEPVVDRCAATRIRERAQQSWPALSKTPYGARRRGLLEVGVGEDDVGALAAELEGDPLDLVGARRAMIRCPTSVEPVKHDLAHRGWVTNRSPDDRALARAAR